MRARTPDSAGFIDCDGVRIGYEVHGEGEPTLLLLPTWTIIHSRFWKLQIPYLARHFRVVTYDSPGNGRSDRPLDPGAHGVYPHLAYTERVLDEVGADSAILVGLSQGGQFGLSFAAERPDRVLGLALIGPAIPVLEKGPSERRKFISEHFDKPYPPVSPSGVAMGIRDETGDWTKYNRRYWLDELEDFGWFFFGQCFPEPHSTKQIEDCVGWTTETTGELLAAESDAPNGDIETYRNWARKVSCPVLLVHGTDDHIVPLAVSEELASLTGGELVTMEGSGHIPLARDPVKVNLLIEDFVDRALEVSNRKSQAWTRALDRRKKALYISSPIGLGHARRDLAIAQELKALHPDLEIEWLAQHPVTAVLEQAGEAIHPASEFLASESGHIASEASGHDLHCFQALRSMDEILLANFMIFQEVVEEGHHDVVIGDEAWDIDHFWHENPELKRGAHVWMTDFVGYLPMPDGGEREAYLTADYNAEMIEHIARFPRIRDRAIFVGNPDDIYPDVFGPDLPKIRDWTEEHFDFSGYITGFTPPSPEQAEEWRAELGFAEGEKVCVVTVGGSGVGRDLLEQVIAAYPLAREQVPELRMIAVAGPRIDPGTLPTHPGLEVYGYVDRLYRHLSVCDLAVVQGGLTTTMELTAANRPFLYFPLRNHFEQNFHVRHRLDQYGAGRHMAYAETSVDDLAAAIGDEIGRGVKYRPVENGGAARAASMIAELI